MGENHEKIIREEIVKQVQKLLDDGKITRYDLVDILFGLYLTGRWTAWNADLHDTYGPLTVNGAIVEYVTENLCRNIK